MDNEKKEPIVPEDHTPTGETGGQPGTSQQLPADPAAANAPSNGNAPHTPSDTAEQISIFPEADDWLNQLLGAPLATEEIGADEHAVSSAGLTHPDDLELEKILAENWDDVPDLIEEPPVAPSASPTATPPAEEIVLDQDVLTTLETEFGFVADSPLPKELTEASEEDILASMEADFASDPAQSPQPEEPAQESPEGTQRFYPPETPEAPVSKPRKRAPVRKARPDRPKGYGLLGIPHILATLVWLLIIVVIGTTLGRIAWVCVADLMAFGKPDQEYSITIEENDTLDDIAQKLGELGVIRYPTLFKLFAQYTGKGERISTGTFRLNSALDYNALINSMVAYSDAKNIINVTIPEGYNCAQIFKLLEDSGVCSIEDLEEYAASGELDDFWFLAGVKRGTRYCLEGYLFPNTYTFYLEDSPERVLEKFLYAFDSQFNDRMKEAFTTMQQTYAKRLQAFGFSSAYIENHPLTLHQVVTLASIVQGETSSDEESYDIASVFYNRLVNPDHQYLGSDATVYYAIGDYFHQKDELTAADIATDSPYNTRNSKGLPPGPICNPGNATLYAALDPNQTDYYYFVYDAAQGFHLFSKTYAEHQDKVNKLGL